MPCRARSTPPTPASTRSRRSASSSPRSRDDVVRTVETLPRSTACSMTMRGGGTSQAGQAIGRGRHPRHVEVSSTASSRSNAAERWARVEPGIVLDELNAALTPHGLRFAPDISTASRATRRRHDGQQLLRRAVGDLRQDDRPRARAARRAVRRIDGPVPAAGRPDARGTLRRRRRSKPRCYRAVRATARAARRTRSSAAIRRSCGASAATTSTRSSTPARPFNLAQLIVGSEGTLGVVVEARVEPGAAAEGQGRARDPVRRSARRAGGDAGDPRASPSAVEVMDRFILDHTRQSADARARCATSSTAIRRRSSASSSTATARRICRRGSRRSSATSRRGVRAIATRARSTPRRRRRSGSCARPRSACRWR